MKKFTVLLLLVGLIIFVPKAHAQMMGFSSSAPDNSAIQAQQQDEQEGKNLLDQLNNKSITCQNLTDDQFEKIGEYFMGQSIGGTARHIQMNNMMKSMMGEQGEAQMHTAWGKRGSNCDNNASLTFNDGIWRYDEWQCWLDDGIWSSWISYSTSGNCCFSFAGNLFVETNTKEEIIL